MPAPWRDSHKPVILHAMSCCACNMTALWLYELALLCMWGASLPYIHHARPCRDFEKEIAGMLEAAGAHNEEAVQEAEEALALKVRASAKQMP